MGFTLEPVDGRCLVHLRDSVTVNCATELHGTLVEALASGKPVEIDFERATEVDVSAIQLLDAAAKSAESSGGTFTLSGILPDMIAKAFRLCGLDPFARPLTTTVECE
jgi:anti-anti-sigma regulatory factor